MIIASIIEITYTITRCHAGTASEAGRGAVECRVSSLVLMSKSCQFELETRIVNIK